MSRADLDPFYARAHPMCGLGSYRYDPAVVEDAANPRLPLEGDRVRTAIYQVSSPPTRFGQAYREEIRRSPNIRTYLHANVVEAVASPDGGRIEQIRVARLDGKQLAACARVYVLATGAVENARLLLVSNRTRGLGNDHDLIGRYFMEHVHVPAALFLPSNPSLPLGLYQEREAGGMRAMAILVPSPSVLRREELLNVRAFVNPFRDSSMELWRTTSVGVVLADSVLEDMRKRKLFDGFSVHLANVLSSLGMRRVELRWRFGGLEKRTLDRTVQILAEELGRSGLGTSEARPPRA